MPQAELTTIEDLKQLGRRLNVPVDAIHDVSILARPVQAGTLHLPNSLAVHPMEGCDAADGAPADLTFRRYERFAAGAAGLIWAEAIAVTAEARAHPHQLWINDNNKHTFRKLIETIHSAAKTIKPSHKPAIIAQLTHSGRYCRPEGTPQPLIVQHDPYRDGMSSQPAPLPAKQPQISPDLPPVTDDYLQTLPAKYARAARLAFEAGFDAVDIKACHGYLISELLASHQRKGKYGGSFENRTRLLLEIIDAIRNQLGIAAAVTTRLGVYDGLPYPFGWAVDKNDYKNPDLAEPEKLIALLKGRGVKMINITAANPYYNPHLSRPFDKPVPGGYEQPEHPLLGVSRLIGLASRIQKKFPDIAVIGTGYSWLRHLMPNVAAASKANGLATVIGAGRLALAYPDFAKDIIIGRRLDPDKVCIACSACSEIMSSGCNTGCVVRDNEIYGPIFECARKKATRKSVR